MSEKIFQFKVGSFECVVMKDGYREVSGDIFAGSASEEEKSRILAEYQIEPDKFPLTVNILAVNTGTQHILIDTGIGRDIGIGAGKVSQMLTSLGIQPEDIDLIIITHGHADHVGGITNEEGHITFPNARYVMSKTEWDFWHVEENLTKMDEGMRSLVQLGLAAMDSRVQLVDGECEIADGLCLIPAAGHTVGQMAVLIESEGEQLLHIADVAHHPLQVTYPQMNPAFDTLPDISQQTRRDLIQRACDRGMVVAAYHFDFPGLGHVYEEGDKLMWRVFGQ